MSKNILITGGSGFVGSYQVEKFSKNGYHVTIYDLMEPLYPLNGNIDFIKGDIFDTETLKAAVEKNETIVHLVGLADASKAQSNPMLSYNLNVQSLQNLLEICRIVGNRKIIFPSSASIYGMSEDLPIKENAPLKPTTIYPWHKLLCEKMLQAYQVNYGVDYVILRLFNVYGKGNEGIIGLFLDKTKKREEILSFGPFQYRDFIYAGDVAEAVYKAVAYDKAVNRIINIGSGKGIQIREILKIICEIVPEARWKEVKSQYPLYDSIADITLAKILLDFEPHASTDFLKHVIETEMIK